MKNQMTNFAMFAFNYPHNFIEQVWKDDPRMMDHYKHKFAAIYESVGNKAVMVKFYMELDTQAQNVLADFINDYYNLRRV